MGRGGLGTAESDGYTAENIAEYFVEQLQNNDTNNSSRTVLRRYFDQTKNYSEDQWTPDLTELATYLHNDAKTSEAVATEDKHWDRLTEDLADYLSREMDAINDLHKYPEGVRDVTDEDKTRKTIKTQEQGPVCPSCLNDVGLTYEDWVDSPQYTWNEGKPFTNGEVEEVDRGITSLANRFKSHDIASTVSRSDYCDTHEDVYLDYHQLVFEEDLEAETQ